MERTKMPNLRNGTNGGFEPGLTWLRVRRSTTELLRSIKMSIRVVVSCPSTLNEVQVLIREASTSSRLLTHQSLLLSASPVRGHHSGFFIFNCSYLLHPPPSLQPFPCPLTASINPLFGLPPFPLSFLCSILVHPKDKMTKDNIYTR